MKLVVALLFTCLSLMTLAQNKQLSYEAEDDIDEHEVVAAYQLPIKQKVTRSAQIVFQPTPSGFSDTDNVILTRYDSKGRILSRETYDYQPPDRRDYDFAFPAKNYLIDGEGVSFIYNKEGYVAERRAYKVAATNSQEAGVFSMMLSRRDKKRSRSADNEKDLQRVLDSLNRVEIEAVIMPEGLTTYAYDKDGNRIYSYDSTRGDSLRYLYTYYPNGLVKMQQVIWYEDTTERHIVYDNKQRITSIDRYHRRGAEWWKNTHLRHTGHHDSSNYYLQSRELLVYDKQDRVVQQFVLSDRDGKMDTTSRTLHTFYGKDSMDARYYFDNGTGAITGIRVLVVYNKKGLPVDSRRYVTEARGGERLQGQTRTFYDKEADGILASRKVSLDRKPLKQKPHRQEMQEEQEAPVQVEDDVNAVEPGLAIPPPGVGAVEPLPPPPPPTIFSYVEQMPEFPGDLNKYLADNMRYPEGAKTNHVQGRVIVHFVVTEDGSIEGAKVTRSIHKELDEEAIRLIRAMPKWKPAKQNGRPVKVYYTLPVSFKLD